MSDERFCIQKYVGVTPQQLANLQAILVKEPIRREGTVGNGWGPNYFVTAEILSTKWDRDRGTVTVEVAVYDRSRRYIQKNGEWSCFVYDSYSASREVIEAILDALERFPKNA
jgi:hypothetical protein